MLRPAHLCYMSQTGTAGKILPEELEIGFASLRHNFHFTGGKISGVSRKPAALGSLLGKVPVPDSLNAAANNKALRTQHGGALL